MARRKRIAIAKPWMEKFFDDLDQRVFTQRDLYKVLDEKRVEWRLPVSLGSYDFIEYLCTKSHLRPRELSATAPKYEHKKVLRYEWRQASYLELGNSLRGGSYLSHSTAVFLHGLSDELPKTVFVNKEQSPKPSNKGSLVQSSIDRAFSKKSRQRRSSLAYSDGEHEFVMLSGKNTSDAGVVETTDPYGGHVRTTSIERTLIDIAVRPAYAGGVDRVVDVYREAVGQAQVSRIIQLLRRIDYVYPYHQVIGFYATRGGFAPESLERLKKLGLDFDFYLTYGMSEPDYDEEWRLFIPKGT